MHTEDTEPFVDLEPSLTISPESICFIVVKMRQRNAKEQLSDPDSGSNAADDKMYDVLEESANDSVNEELSLYIDALNEDEQSDLVALAWMGRGDGEVSDWATLRAEADRAHNRRTTEYLMGITLLADHLEAALDALGLSCDEFEMNHL